MKNLLRFLIEKILIFRAKQYLRKSSAQVIAITGSVGKTGVKEALYCILKNHFEVLRSPGGFNTPIGMSLAILQEEKSGFTSPFAWLGILKRAFFKPKKLFRKIILEMGADRPGDIKKLVKIAKPEIGIIINVNPVHLGSEQFKDIEDIGREKNCLIKNMKKNCLAVLNFDDPLVKNMKTGAEKMSYGLAPWLDVFASDVRPSAKNLMFKAAYKGENAEFKVPVPGSFHVYTFLPAIACAVRLGISLKDCAKALEDYKLPPGRMNIIPGVNKSMILDSSYNASPASMLKAMELLAEINAPRKIAALGTMNELGDLSKEEHIKLGGNAAKTADVLIAVGPEAALIKQGAIEAGMKECDIYTFFDSEEAGHFLKTLIAPKDLILVKGSQNRVRMERLVKIIMERPEDAHSLLCRQDGAWGKI